MPHRRLEPVDEYKQEQPYHIDEVPVPGHSLKCEMVIRLEMAFHAPEPDDDQHDGSHRHVESMEAGQHVERRAVNATGQLEIELRIGMAVLVGLESQKSDTQQDGQPQPENELASVERALPT